jgi:hypothetical protein
MDDARTMGSIERAGDLDGVVKRPVEGQRPS